MHEHDHESPETRSAERPPAAGARGVPPAIALQRAAGNRAVAQMLSRLETADAVDRLEQALGPGVLGAERQVVDTLQAYTSDVTGFDKLTDEFEKKTERPLTDSLSPDAQALQPEGWYKGISGEGGAS